MTRSAHRKSGICAVVAPGRNSVQFSAFITSEQERAAEVMESTAFHALRSNSEVDIRDQIVILWTMFVYWDNYFCLHTNSFPKKIFLIPSFSAFVRIAVGLTLACENCHYWNRIKTTVALTLSWSHNRCSFLHYWPEIHWLVLQFS